MVISLNDNYNMKNDKINTKYNLYSFSFNELSSLFSLITRLQTIFL